MKFGNFENPSGFENKESSLERAKFALDKTIDPAKELIDNQLSKFNQSI